VLNCNRNCQEEKRNAENAALIAENAVKSKTAISI
jgi:hypothetical protein